MVLAEGRPCLVIPARCASTQPLDAALLDLLAGSPAAGGFSQAAAAADPATVGAAREALLALSAANLVCLLREPEEASLTASLRPADDDYDPRLTSSAAELCIASIRLMLGPPGPSSELVDTADCDTLLVLARPADPREVPYPVAMRGNSALSMRDLLVLVRSVFELCALDPIVESHRVGPYVVTLADEADVWHFVADRRLVSVSARRDRAAEALARAVAVASEAP